MTKWIALFLIQVLAVGPLIAAENPDSNPLLEVSSWRIQLSQAMVNGRSLPCVSGNELRLVIVKVTPLSQGHAVEFYGGFCANGLSKHVQFLNGQIFNLDFTDNRISDTPIGTYSDSGIHFKYSGNSNVEGVTVRTDVAFSLQFDSNSRNRFSFSMTETEASNRENDIYLSQGIGILSP